MVKPGMPKKPTPHKSSHNQEVEESYILLDVDPDEVASQPKIEHLFRDIGGVIRVFEYLEGSEEPEARRILEARNRLSVRQAAVLPFEAFCVAAKVPTKKAFGVISQEVMEQGAKASALIARARHPEVVQYTVEQALTPAGTQERKMLHLAAGMLPQPKGNVTVFGGVAIDSRNQQVNVSVLPPVEDSAKRLADRFGELSRPVIDVSGEE